MAASLPANARNAPSSLAVGRHRRTARQRREQYERSHARVVQTLLKEFAKLESHRGAHPNRLGAALHAALRTNDTSATPSATDATPSATGANTSTTSANPSTTCAIPSATHVTPPATRAVCRHYLKGKCLWGDACRFAHVDGNGHRTLDQSSDLSTISKAVQMLSESLRQLTEVVAAIPALSQRTAGPAAASLAHTPVFGNGVFVPGADGHLVQLGGAHLPATCKVPGSGSATNGVDDSHSQRESNSRSADASATVSPEFRPNSSTGSALQGSVPTKRLRAKTTIGGVPSQAGHAGTATGSDVLNVAAKSIGSASSRDSSLEAATFANAALAKGPKLRSTTPLRRGSDVQIPAVSASSSDHAPNSSVNVPATTNVNRLVVVGKDADGETLHLEDVVMTMASRDTCAIIGSVKEGKVRVKNLETGVERVVMTSRLWKYD